MTDNGSRALEAAVRALRERNEVLEADRQLLGARVAELEKRLERMQGEMDRLRNLRRAASLARRLLHTSPVRLVGLTRRGLSGPVRVAARRRRRRARTNNANGSDQGTAAVRPPLEVRDRRPTSPGPRRLRVLGILDAMSAECFSKTTELHLPPPSAAAGLLKERQFDFVLVESAWQGNEGSWQYRVGSYATPEHRGIPALRRLVDAARERDIPTVFWNKEDPVHFAKFAEAARLFDYVFTTDAQRIGTYRALMGRAQRVEALQFAAEPGLHNPIGGAERSPSPVFAGTFYQKRYLDRQDSLRALLEAAAPYGLRIYDRMHGSGQDGFSFPESVANCVVGGLPYTDLVHEYRRHRIFLNANSVVNSPTMFARRVFELLACGTPVVSTPSRGMTATFPLLVDAVDSQEEAKVAIERLLFDEAHWFRRSRAGICSVMFSHTYAHRVAQIAQVLGLEGPEAGPSVALVCCGGADDLRLVLPTLERAPGVKEIAVPSDTPGAAIRRLYDAVPGIERVVRFDSGAGHGPGSMRSAADWIRSSWLVDASDLVGRDPSLLTDLLVATVFSGESGVVGRPGGTRTSLFTLTSAEPGDVVMRRTADVVAGVSVDEALLASVD